MRRAEDAQGQGAPEYVGVLALVALIVAGAVPFLPGAVGTAATRAACRVVQASPCPAAPVSAAPASPAPATVAQAPPSASLAGPRFGAPAALAAPSFRGVTPQRLPSRPLPPGEPESERWRDCPQGHLCLYDDYNYENLIYSQPVPESPDHLWLRLPDEAKDRMNSWVNNTDWDLCGANNTAGIAIFQDTNTVREVLPGSAHAGGASRAPVAGDSADDRDDVDRFIACPQRDIVEPLVPVAQGGPDCPYGYVCLYDDADFRNEIYRYNGGAPDSPGRSEEDYRLQLPAAVADRVSSWANHTSMALCAYDHRTLRRDTKWRMAPTLDFYDRRPGSQDRWVGREANDRFDRIDVCR